MESENLLTSNVEYLKEALTVLKELDKAKNNRNSLTVQLKQIERDIAGEEKSVQDEIEITVKKRREEIAVSFDKEIRKDQDHIRKIKADRDKAKAKGMAGRIEAETADIREENKQLHKEIKAVIKEAKLPHFCSQSWYFYLFCPKRAEWIMLLLTLVLCFYALPYGICFVLKVQKLEIITGISFACSFLFFLVYQIISIRTKGNKWAAIRQIRTLREKAAANRKKERAICNAIHKDKDEQPYNLEQFDKEIRELEEEVHSTTSEKQEALSVFDEVTKKMLIDEIDGRSREKINALKQNQQETASGLKDAETLVKNINKHLTANYEAFLGKDYVKEDAIRKMITLMEERHLATVAEALVLYKSEY